MKSEDLRRTIGTMEVDSVDSKSQEILDRIIKALESGGYDPDAHLTGIVMTGYEAYITHRDGARDAIRLLDKNDIRDYLDKRDDQ